MIEALNPRTTYLGIGPLATHSVRATTDQSPFTVTLGLDPTSALTLS